ncbi:lipopolysaccharide assembly protein LapA domain-containing protein [Catenulispora subtropica]|uniref:Lipopolysaccharide assembly protein A domain-containing protein n=1 Tax=Catenulispora subtropica TaxID=450798 RepID=A0ABN2RBB3_9ACTN
MRRTRTGYAWIAICAAIAVLIALVVFTAQNSQPVQVSFLAWHGRLPLAVALLAAAASAGATAAGVGSARIMQLRRVSRRLAGVEEPAAGQGTGNVCDTLEIPMVETQSDRGLPDQTLPAPVSAR